MTLMQGNAPQMALRDNSIHCVFTSPPYYGLRIYENLPPQVWGGNSGCRHEWDVQSGKITVGRKDSARRSQSGVFQNGGNPIGAVSEAASTGQLCQKCGAWFGHLGNEPTPEQFIEHLVIVGREIRRVLSPDGVWFLNLGDSFANDTKWGGRSGSKNETSAKGNYAGQRQKRNTGFKPKDKMLIPHRAAIALQEAGWWVRMDIPWLKPNTLPESVVDRPTVAHEYVFMLTKSEAYYWDVEAVKRPLAQSSLGRLDRKLNLIERTGNGIGPNNKIAKNGVNPDHADAGLSLARNGKAGYDPSGRQYRTTDPWSDSLEDLPYGILDQIEVLEKYIDHLEEIRSERGLLLDPDDNPLALHVSTKAYKEAHYAVFPPDLVVDLVRAATSEAGVCPKCGSPWRRVVQKPDFSQQPKRANNQVDQAMISRGNGYLTSAGQAWQEWRNANPNQTLGFEPTCTCNINGLDLKPDDLEIISSPLSSRNGDDPSMSTGRAGFNRPRGEDEGQRPITRYEQRAYAAQLKASPHRKAMKAEAGPAFAHYLRTDRSGARPIPEPLLEAWLEKGWLEQVEIPEFTPFDPVPATVLDCFCGSGTVGEVCRKLGRSFIGVDLSLTYLVKHAAPRAELKTTATNLEDARRELAEKYQQEGQVQAPKGQLELL